ncbi:MAG: chemotaxis protein CheW [Gammaproteobacteria bacterium]|nr:chemotaxis protein CheW [Gammaproteobacteria bacterium]MDH5802336.1 chemotaxis protein CheW [Gammaproteobacteria bacterium]
MNQRNQANTTTIFQKKFLCFYLDDRKFAVPIEYIREIAEYSEITPIPMMPQFVWGALNLRGSVIPILDLSARIGLKHSTLGKRTCFLIVEVPAGNKTICTGLIADSVSEVTDINSDCTDPVPDFGGKFINEFIEGIGRVKNELVMLLNVDTIISMEDIREFYTGLNENVSDYSFSENLERKVS